MTSVQEQKDHAVARAGKIYAIIKKAAEMGVECPTNRLLASRMGCGAQAIINAMDFLAVAGMIEIERFHMSRIVTICATGQQTAGTRSKPHHSARRNAAQDAIAA